MAAKKITVNIIPYNQLEDIDNVLIAYDGELPIGCIGFKHYDKNCAEIKRFFLKEAYRGQGIGHALLNQIEYRAKTKGYNACILETGEPLVAALALYRKNGYQIISNYGPYAQQTEAICMKKIL